MLASLPAYWRRGNRDLGDALSKRCELCFAGQKSFRAMSLPGTEMEEVKVDVCSRHSADRSIKQIDRHRRPQPAPVSRWEMKEQKSNKSYHGHEMLDDEHLVAPASNRRERAEDDPE